MKIVHNNKISMRIKRCLSFLLVFALLITMTPIESSAAESTETTEVTTVSEDKAEVKAESDTKDGKDKAAPKDKSSEETETQSSKNEDKAVESKDEDSAEVKKDVTTETDKEAVTESSKEETTETKDEVTTETNTEATSEVATTEEATTETVEAVNPEAINSANPSPETSYDDSGDDEVIEEDELDVKFATANKGTVKGKQVDGVWQWTIDGAPAFCLTHGSSMHDGIPVHAGDLVDMNTTLGLQISTLISIMYPGQGYNETQKKIWKVQSGDSDYWIKYAKHAISLTQKKSPKDGKITHTVAPKQLTDAQLEDLKNGKSVSIEIPLKASEVKAAQSLLNDCKNNGSNLGVGYSFNIDTKGAAISSASIENIANPSKTAVLSITYKVTDDNAKKTKASVANYISDNGNVSFKSNKFTYGTKLTKVSWKEYYDSTGASGLQELAYSWKSSSASFVVNYSSKAESKTSGTTNLKMVKMDNLGNYYFENESGSFEVTCGGTSLGALNARDAFHNGWTMNTVPCDNGDKDYPNTTSCHVTIRETASPDGLKGFTYRDIGYALKINGVDGIWAPVYYGSPAVGTEYNGTGLIVQEHMNLVLQGGTTHTFARLGGCAKATDARLTEFLDADGNYSVLVNTPTTTTLKTPQKSLKVYYWDSANKKFDFRYENLPGIKFDLYVETSIYDDTEHYKINSAGTELKEGAFVGSAYTGSDGVASWGNLVPGTYRVKEDIDGSKISDDLKKQLKPLADSQAAATANTEAGETEFKDFGTLLETDKNSQILKLINQSVTIDIPVHKEYKAKDGSTKPVQGAEFTLYMTKDYPNILGENILGKEPTVEDAIVGVVNHSPIYESGKWVKITTAVSDANGNADFRVECPRYGSENVKVLVAETGVPDGMRRSDYDKYKYAEPFNDALLNKFGGNGIALETMNFYNEDEADVRITVHKFGEQVIGSTLNETEYGNYYSLDYSKELPLKGREFDIINQKGEIVDTITTGDDGIGESNVKLSARVPYTIREKAGTTNHTLNTDDTTRDDYFEQTITLEPDETKEITYVPATFKNNAIPVNLKIDKQGEVPTINANNETDKDLAAKFEALGTGATAEFNIVKEAYTFTKESVKGAVFGVYTKDAIKAYDGKVVIPADACVGIATTDENGEAKFTTEKYLAGDYYFKEIKTPDNTKYILDKEKHDFSIVVNNEKEINMNLTQATPLVNELYKGSVTIVKKDKNNTYPIKNVTFGLYDEQKTLIATALTDEGGNASWHNLPTGKYFVKELVPAKDYDADDTEYPVYITKDGLDARKVITNNKTSGKIKVIKRDADNNTILISGVVFNLLDNNKKLINTYETDENGEFTTEELPLGKYYLVETRAARGYILDETEHVVDVTNDSRYPEVNLYNKAKKGSIKVIKTDGTKTIYLEGVVFNLYDSNHNFLASYTTNTNGEILITDLRVGTYYLQETLTQKGYVLNDDVVQVDLTDSNLDVILNLVNEEEETTDVSLESDSDNTAKDKTVSEKVVKTGDFFFMLMLRLMILALISATLLFLMKNKNGKKLLLLGLILTSTGVGIFGNMNNVHAKDDNIVDIDGYSEIKYGKLILEYSGKDGKKYSCEVDSDHKAYLDISVEDVRSYKLKSSSCIFIDKYGQDFITSDVIASTIVGIRKISLDKSTNGSFSFRIFYTKTDKYFNTLGNFDAMSEYAVTHYYNNKTYENVMDFIQSNGAGVYCATSDIRLYTPNVSVADFKVTHSGVLVRRFYDRDEWMDTGKYYSIEYYSLDGAYATGVVGDNSIYDLDRNEAASEILSKVIGRVNGKVVTPQNVVLPGCIIYRIAVLENNTFLEIPINNNDVDLNIQSSESSISFNGMSLKGRSNNIIDSNVGIISGDTLYTSDGNISGVNVLNFKSDIIMPNIEGYTYKMGSIHFNANDDILRFNYCDTLSKLEEQGFIDLPSEYSVIEKPNYKYNHSSFFVDGNSGFRSIKSSVGQYNISLQFMLSDTAGFDRSLFEDYYKTYSFYDLDKTITKNSITYHLENGLNARVTSISVEDGVNSVVLPEEVEDEGSYYTVSYVNGLTLSDSVTSITIPDTIKDIDANTFNKETIKDVYVNSPALDVKGKFNADTIIHCYKGSDGAKKCEAAYTNIEYYNIPVKYELDGGSISDEAPEAIYYGEKSVIPDPTREGYNFLGWYEDANLTKPAVSTPYFDKVAESDPKELTYYAGWEKIAKPEVSEVTELNNNDFTDTSKSDAEKELEASKAAKAKEDEAKAKENAANTDKSNTSNSEANKGLVRNGVFASEQTEVNAGTGKFVFKQIKGKKIRVKISNDVADGYEVQFSTNKKFKKSKTKTSTTIIDTSADKTKVIKGLKLGKKYYVRARAFNLSSDGTKVYGDWSKKKVIKIKK